MSDFRCPYPGSDPKPSKRDEFRSPFQADYDRVIYSKPFRRLARKTQVHPLVPNDHVHNRLTHSLEVASVGRSFAIRLYAFLKDPSNRPADFDDQQFADLADDLSQVIQAACLAHDIGNPPFGHAGEFAIRTWVKDRPETIFGSQDNSLTDGIKKDWEIFEGNAQGFRLALLPDNTRAGYMRLTYATLGAMIKYPWCSADSRVSSGKPKYNVFSTEKQEFERAFHAMGLFIDDQFVRHPLSFLTEAADDICYRIADLEDAVHMGILESDRVRTIFASVAGGTDKDKPIEQLRAAAIHCFINSCWDVFVDDYENIMRGQRTEDLKSDLSDQHREALDRIKICYDEIFAHRFKVSTEFGAYRCLGRISSTLCDAVRKLSEARDFDKLDFPVQRCFELAFSKEYATENQEQSYEWWLHQTLDCVSGMTDNYAKQFSNDLEGL